MHYLVTGGAGFIGSHLSERLIGQGHFVTVLDDLSTGCLDNLRQLEGREGFRCIVDTATNRARMEQLVDEADAVFHLAAAVGVRLVMERPVHAIETNLRATECILECAAKSGKRVLISSSSEVYGKSTAIPFREDSQLVLGPVSKGRWAYACSKAMDEFLALAFYKERRCPVVIARLFNIVGPRQTGRYGMVLPNLVRQALAGEPLTVFGDGAQTRCFTHVADVVRALVALMSEPRSVGYAFNVGTCDEISIRDLALMVARTTGSSSNISFVPYRLAYGDDDFEDTPRRVPDLSRIHALLGYRPELTLEQAIADVATDLRRRQTSTGPASRPERPERPEVSAEP